MARKKGAELIAEFLINEKIPYVFGICGHGNVGLLDELYTQRDKIKLISPRHEQVAGHMADAYFRVKHKAVNRCLAFLWHRRKRSSNDKSWRR